jgi:hypothetical protein
MKRIAIGACILLPLGAQAQEGQAPPCGAFKALAAALKEHAGEEPVSEALGADGRMWVTFVAQGGVTWTLVSVDAAGKACMQMLGRGFSVSRPPPKGEAS